MKKILYFAATVAAVVAFAACSKEHQGNAIVAGETVTLKASINLNGQSTKVAPDDLTKETVSFHWEIGDKVTISNGTGSQEFTVSNFNGDSADLVGTALTDMNNYTATYSTAVDGTVSYIEDSFKPIVSGTGSGASVTLDTFCPVIALSLKGSAVIKAIKYYIGDVLKSTLDCGTSGIELTSTAKTVYFPVLSTATANNAKIEFYEGDVMILQKTITSEVPGKIVSFPELLLYPYYENGNFYGLGIPITTTYVGEITTTKFVTIWAPVNCGYEPTNYKYGKLYQWGRKDGCGYIASEYDETSVNNDAGGVIQTYSTWGNLYDVVIDPSKFYEYWTPSVYKQKWGLSYGNNTVIMAWVPANPCPSGWRVPTTSEINLLSGGDGTPGTGYLNYSSWDDTNKGYWFDGTHSPQSSTGLFLPAAGERSCWTGGGQLRGSYGRYWTSSLPGNDYGPTMLWFNNECCATTHENAAYGNSVRCIKDY